MVLIVCMIMIIFFIIRSITRLKLTRSSSFQHQNNNKRPIRITIESRNNVPSNSSTGDHNNSEQHRHSKSHTYKNRKMPSIKEDYDYQATPRDSQSTSDIMNTMEKVLSNSEDNSPASIADTEPDRATIDNGNDNDNASSQIRLSLDHVMEIGSEEIMSVNMNKVRINKNKSKSNSKSLGIGGPENLTKLFSRAEGQEKRMDSMDCMDPNDTNIPTIGGVREDGQDVGLWLVSLNLSQDYLQLFTENGFDEVGYIQQIEHKEDLIEIGITNEQDLQILMDAIMDDHDNDNQDMKEMEITENGKEREMLVESKIIGVSLDLCNDDEDESVFKGHLKDKPTDLILSNALEEVMAQSNEPLTEKLSITITNTDEL